MKKMIFLAAAVAGPLLAHDGMHGPAAVFDKDGDGSLSVQEYTAYLAASKEDASQAEARFKTLDANGDGKVSSGEFMRGQPKKPST